MRYLGETFMQIFVELFCRNDIQWFSCFFLFDCTVYVWLFY